ncbi:L-lactate dehydrogenase 1 [Oxobacter pfennigii]|uniref:L-lactate dehydrogenase 1 n=1 Tax=Oxobacter pfennigii TaxID=36849 RepID=A0A0N8NTV9_9CLOT|nr:lactate dehydrogenase [Oxobacter pfennigii]KPU45920.1 L-lactate dehydrogenase 1 [Oxobacter pfennigii]
MYFYKHKDCILASLTERKNFNSITEAEASQYNGILYVLNEMEPLKSRRSFCITSPSHVFLQKEGLELLKKSYSYKNSLPHWLEEKINKRMVTSLNTLYPDWEDVLDFTHPKKWRINVAGLGDVGGILATGLKLLGGKNISALGLYDINEHKIRRWCMEIGQIALPSYKPSPEILPLKDEELFDCDMFVYCVSKGVPPADSEIKDVRMYQYESNSKIIKTYAKMARNNKFKGTFAVVSDPVDLLCNAVFKESNCTDKGMADFKGLAPEQIRGFGLGVMHARAAYYSREQQETLHYEKEGRVFGPHGEGLVVSDSIKKYNHELSIMLTKKTINANMKIRETGFKPYAAPALSSGSLPIIATITGKWHYSAVFLGGVFMGCKNRLIASGTEIETLDIPELLWQRLKNTYNNLSNSI